MYGMEQQDTRNTAAFKYSWIKMGKMKVTVNQANISEYNLKKILPFSNIFSVTTHVAQLANQKWPDVS
jgi:hypothetical protein